MKQWKTVQNYRLSKKIMELIEAIDSDPEIKNEFRNMAGKVK